MTAESNDESLESTHNERDRLELLERQLAERVTERVQKSLFKVYSVAGVAVIGVLGLIGYNILSVIEDKTDEAATELSKEITSLNKRAAEIPAEVTDQILDGLKEQNKEIIISTAETQASARRARKLIQDVEDALENFEPQVQTMDESLKKIASLEVTAKNVEASFPEIKSLVASVKDIADQITELAQQVDQINSDLSVASDTTPSSLSIGYEERGESIKSVIEQSTQTVSQLSNYEDSITLFVQFASSTRPQIEEVTEALTDFFNYKIPGEERTTAAFGKHVVKYFHAIDRDTAAKIAEDVNTVLRQLEYNDKSRNHWLNPRGKNRRQVCLNCGWIFLNVDGSL